MSGTNGSPTWFANGRTGGLKYHARDFRMDEIFSFVRGVFSGDLLVVALPELVAPLRIPERSKRYLLDVGLPREIDFVGGSTLRFNLLHRLPTLRELLPEHASKIDPGWDDCRFLALDEYDAGYVLNQADGGSVWSVALDSPNSSFVNSSVELFGWFIAQYMRVRSGAASGEDDATRVIDHWEQKMLAMDPRAMSDDAEYWPVIVEDARLYSS